MSSFAEIVVVAPSSPFDRARYAAGLAVLQAFGLPIREADGLFAADRYLAGSDAHRADQLRTALAGDGDRLVIAARGGYGCTRLLPLLSDFRPGAATLCGFSDVTAALCWLERAGGRAVHGPVVTQLATLDDGTLQAFEQFLRQGSVAPLHGRSLRQGLATGRLVGGNLSLLCAMLGTRHAPDFDEAILFLEDVGEAGYRVDRMLTQLRQAGIFDQCRGLVLGEFSGTPGELVRALEQELAQTVERPILVEAPIGHGSRNQPLPFGAVATLRCDGERANLSVAP